IINLLGNTTFGQHYFSKSYDPFDHGTESVYNLATVNNQIWISAGGLCDNFSIDCYKKVIVDEQGALLEASEMASFDPGNDPVFTEDGYHFIGGDDTPVRTHFNLYKSDLNGDSIQLIDLIVDEDSLYTDYYHYGIVEYNDQIVVYGQVTDNQDLGLTGTAKVKGLLFWVDKDMTVDTFTIIEPPFDWLVLSEAIVDPNNYLTLTYQFTEILNNGQRLRRSAIIKLDEQKQKVFEWQSPDFGDGGGLGTFEILADGKMVGNFDDITNRQVLIYALNPDGTMAWEFDFAPRSYENYEVSDLTTTEEGQIVGCGTYINTRKIQQTGFIFKLDAEGQLLWKRIFTIGVGEHPLNAPESPKRCWLNDIIELPNGDLTAGGRMYNYYDDPVLGPRNDIDLWLVKMDAEGCIEADCGEDLILTNTHDVLNNLQEVRIFPNPVTQNLYIQNANFDTYEIFSITGQRLRAGTFNNNPISFENLPSGTYLIQLRSDKHPSQTFKIAKK
ncbi:MAG: T9SS type A sorting domain-containing protein, partial [Bacteroidota bacterium]